MICPEDRESTGFHSSDSESCVLPAAGRAPAAGGRPGGGSPREGRCPFGSPRCQVCRGPRAALGLCPFLILKALPSPALPVFWFLMNDEPSFIYDPSPAAFMGQKMNHWPRNYPFYRLRTKAHGPFLSKWPWGWVSALSDPPESQGSSRAGHNYSPKSPQEPARLMQKAGFLLGESKHF